MREDSKFSKVMVGFGVCLLIAGVVFNIFSEREARQKAAEKETQEETTEKDLERIYYPEFQREEYLKTAEWGTLERELKKMGISDFGYYIPEDDLEESDIPTPDLPRRKTLIGTINKSIQFKVEEDDKNTIPREHDNREDDLILILKGEETNAVDVHMKIEPETKLYVSCDGMILLTEEQMSCLRRLVNGEVN